MIWTRTPPAAPGFYWWKRLEDLVVTEAVRVVESVCVLYLERPGIEDLYKLDEYECLWGSEPIQQPSES